MATRPIEDPAQDAGPEQLSAFQRLSEDAVTALQGALKSALKSDQVSRRDEVRHAWKLRDYCRGKQHAVYDSRNYLYITLQASGEALPMHMGTYDIISPQKRTFVSILSENPPGVNFIPNDLGQANDVTAAKMGEKMRARVDRMVSMRDKQQKVAGYLCTDGRVIAWTHVDQYGKLCVDLYGVLESKVPAFARDREEYGYCVLSREVDKWRAKWEYPDFADDIESADAGAGESAYERYARLGVISKSRGGNTESLKGLTTEHYCWVMPWRYAKMTDSVRDEIKTAFPDGVVIHAFGNTVVDGFSASDPLRAGDLAVEFPVDGEGQIRPALLSGVPDIQDAYNDVKNLLRELAEYGSPATWVNTDAGIDLEAIADQRAEPAAVHGIAAGNRPLSEVILQEEPSVISQQVVAMLPDLKQDAEYNTGAYAQLQGDEINGQDTVGVNKLLTNQAKGQLGPAWSAIQRLWAKIYPTAVRIAATLEQKPVAISGPNGQDTVDPQLILDGNFYCHPDQDSSFPETTADKRAALQAVFSQIGADPQGSGIIFQPDNLKLIKQYSGLKDLVIPGAEARDKQLQQIEQMLNEAPIPPDYSQYLEMAAHNPQNTQALGQYAQMEHAAQAKGQPAPPPPQFNDANEHPIPMPQPQPSVSIDEEWDYHQPMVDKIQEWLSSDACAEALRSGKTDGVQNIRLQGAARRAVLAKQAQAAAPAPVPPKVSLTAAITDPAAIAQLTAQAGATTASPQGEAQAQLPEVEKTVAQTNHANAQALRVSVLAARERVKPHDIQIVKPNTPDNSGGGVN